MFTGPLIDCFLLVLLFSGIPLIISSAAGVAIGVLQAATQVQEQSISYTVKFGAVSLALLFMAGWMGRELVHFFQECFLLITPLGQY